MYYPLGYKPALDGLRALAILPVLLFHGGAPGFQWGYIGVDIFFVISGYLITGILLKEHAQTGHISLLNFYRRRALRLLPALSLLCFVILAAAYTFLQNPMQGWEEVVITILYFGNWTRSFGIGLPQYLGHTWSLAIEEQFYMLWPLLLLAILGLCARAVSALRLIGALVIIVICWRAMLTLQGATADRLYNGTDTRADALLIGSALAVALSIPALAGRFNSVARYLGLPAAVIIVAIPVLLPWNDRYMFLGGFSVVAFAVATLLTAALHNVPLASILGNPLLVWVGQRSYGLYLWHYPIALACVLQFHIPHGWRLSSIEIVSAFACAAFSYKFIELPFLRRRYISPPIDQAQPSVANSN